MMDDVTQSIAELNDVVRCRCNPAYTGRGLHDPECQCDSADAVKTVSDEIAALQARVAQLEAERDVYRELAVEHTKAELDARAEAAEALLSEAVKAGMMEGARVTQDDDGHFTVWGEDRNTRVSQTTASDAAKAIRALASDPETIARIVAQVKKDRG